MAGSHPGIGARSRVGYPPPGGATGELAPAAPWPDAPTDRTAGV